MFNWCRERNMVKLQEDHWFLLRQKALTKAASRSTTEARGAECASVPKLVENEELPTSKTGWKSQNESAELIQLCLCGTFDVSKEIVSRNISVAVYGVIMTAGVIALTVLNIMGTTYQLLYGCVGILVILCATGFLCIPMTIMKANIFGWCQQVSYILISGGTDNFYMSDASCLPDGPHFSQTFYNTVGAVIGNAASVFGVYLFARVFSKQSYRVTLICTTLVQVLASVFDIIIVERWNLYIGIPDHAMYIMGDAIVYEVCYMLNFMPLNMLISRLCPKGYESTMFAILASFSNMGASTSSTIGAILMETVWPLSSSPPCDFSNLRWLLISGHFITPLIAIPLVIVLIPGTRIYGSMASKERAPLFFHKGLIKSGKGLASVKDKDPVLTLSQAS
ncbi:BT1 family protein [Leishmania donovani]|nr:BT1 family protein [Leishmania donovani]